MPTRTDLTSHLPVGDSGLAYAKVPRQHRVAAQGINETVNRLDVIHDGLRITFCYFWQHLVFVVDVDNRLGADSAHD